MNSSIPRTESWLPAAAPPDVPPTPNVPIQDGGSFHRAVQQRHDAAIRTLGFGLVMLSLVGTGALGAVLWTVTMLWRVVS
ncbi:hypothetical protein [Streptomyces yaizuensis]|uniref:Uncharacterized protein n=1 Tax=Streptomyces yaizuensis TaxID=2989713 RepID=A0AA86IVF6_9ACTN|nr:hypothetical protein [Streptomyces sp. YSPA8]BDT39556.1 hypothetical protein SYYSPA8_37190 [Streptomyces sp. YSPA8]